MDGILETSKHEMQQVIEKRKQATGYGVKKKSDAKFVRAKVTRVS